MNDRLPTESVAGAGDRACVWICAQSARRGAWWGAFIFLTVVLLVPLLLVDVPPLLDYPNHMARMYVLAFGPSDPVLSKMYAPNWSIIPNLALDLLIPPALRIMPLDVAGRIAIACAIMLPFLGCIVLSRVVYRRRAWWPLLAAFPVYNVGLRLGLLNFLIGVGVALLLAAAWAAWRPRRPGLALLVVVPGAAVLFFCHIMGVALLMLLLGCHELAAIFFARVRRVRAAFIRGALLLVVFAAPLALYARSNVAGTWSVVAWPTWSQFYYGAFAAFICQSRILDIVTGLACLLFVYLCLRLRRAETRAWLTMAWLVLALGYCVAPVYFKGTGFFETRFSVMYGLLLFAAVVPRRLPPRAAVGTAVVAIGLLAARMGIIDAAWWEHNRDLAELRATIALVEPGSRVFVTYVTPMENQAYWDHAPAARSIPGVFQAEKHEAALLLTERHAFWPQLFTIPSQQPLRVLPPYEALSAPEVDTPPHSVLSGRAAADVARNFPILRDWHDRFDYLLLLDAGGEPDLKGWYGPGLELLKATDAAALYRIVQP